MPIEDTTVVGSDGWWFKTLLKRLADRQDRLKRLNDYYVGNADLPDGAESARQAFRNFQRKARTNFAELVVEAVRERMQPVGFRTAGSSDDLGDKSAWRVWQANNLDADSNLVTRDHLAMGDGYAIVGPTDIDIGEPLITPEDPRQVITAHDPKRRRKIVAALKVFHDDVEQADIAYLYLLGGVGASSTVRRAVRRGKAGTQAATNVNAWTWLDDASNDSGVGPVPVVRFWNRPDTYGNSLGEFEDVIDILDRVNHMLLQRLMIATLQAFRQRAVKNVPMRDAEGNDIDYTGMFSSGPDAMWLLPEGAEMWESGQVDLTPILTAVRHDVMDLAATTRTPLFYLTPDATNGSAEGASLAREGLVFKVEDRIMQASDSWEQVMSLAFLFKNDAERADRASMKTLWAPPERFSLAERFDAASKALPAGVPWRTTMRDVLQFDPEDIEQMESERTADAALAGIFGQVPVASAAPQTAGVPGAPAT